eukprot:444479-Amphidinium_carterae.2
MAADTWQAGEDIWVTGILLESMPVYTSRISDHPYENSAIRSHAESDSRLLAAFSRSPALGFQVHLQKTSTVLKLRQLLVRRLRVGIGRIHL